MRKIVAVAAIVLSLVAAGCSAQGQTIKGSVDTVIDEAGDMSVDDEFNVEVTGYIIGDEPAGSLGGSDEEHATLQLYEGTTEEEQGYIIAAFSETPEELNDLIIQSTSDGPIRKVTIKGKSKGRLVGTVFMSMHYCEIVFPD